MQTRHIIKLLRKASNLLESMAFENGSLEEQVDTLQEETVNLQNAIDDLEEENAWLQDRDKEIDQEFLQDIGIADENALTLAIECGNRKNLKDAAFHLARAIPQLDFTKLTESQP